MLIICSCLLSFICMEIEIWLNAQNQHLMLFQFKTITVTEMHEMEKKLLHKATYFQLLMNTASCVRTLFTSLVLFRFLKTGSGRSSGIAFIYRLKENKNNSCFRNGRVAHCIEPDESTCERIFWSHAKRQLLLSKADWALTKTPTTSA